MVRKKNRHVGRSLMGEMEKESRRSNLRVASKKKKRGLRHGRGRHTWGSVLVDNS